MAPPKAILFDIGGVCVVSPFQAILDYERENGIPIGYINFAIQKGPHDTGAWQQIERGQVALDDSWFASFAAQLSRPEVWQEYLQRNNNNNKQAATTTTTTTTTTTMTTIPPVPAINAKQLFWRMMRISRTPDPYMYPALKHLQSSGRFILGALSNTVAFPTGILDDNGILFDKSLVHAPPPNPHAHDSTDIATCFDVFVSSAHAGVRKPSAAAYELAVAEMERKGWEMGRLRKGERLAMRDVLFLDDIGGNLKGARGCGMRTLKVDLGETRRAVGALGGEVGLRLGVVEEEEGEEKEEEEGGKGRARL